MQKQDYQNLRECPFCGSTAKMVKDGTSCYKIFCTSIYCDAQMGWCSSEELLAGEWNRRVKHPDCEAAEHDFAGCLGYGHSENDDEPIPICANCKKYTGNLE